MSAQRNLSITPKKWSTPREVSLPYPDGLSHLYLFKGRTIQKLDVPQYSKCGDLDIASATNNSVQQWRRSGIQLFTL